MGHPAGHRQRPGGTARGALRAARPRRGTGPRLALRQKLLKLTDLHYDHAYPPMTSSDRRYTVEPCSPSSDSPRTTRCSAAKRCRAGNLRFGEQIRAGRPGTVDPYLNVLRAGGIRHPHALLMEAGVDLSTPRPYEALVRRMNAVMDEMEKLLG
jgi:hypothetical protein